jgi:hypothetical protein
MSPTCRIFSRSSRSLVSEAAAWFTTALIADVDVGKETKNKTTPMLFFLVRSPPPPLDRRSKAHDLAGKAPRAPGFEQFR